MGNPSGANIGHGHVFPRADGAKMRCGGPRICDACARDLARRQAADTTAALRALVALIERDAAANEANYATIALAEREFVNAKRAVEIANG